MPSAPRWRARWRFYPPGLLGALWGGAYILNFFGISLGALALPAECSSPFVPGTCSPRPSARRNASRRRPKSAGRVSDDIAFFPLTLPFTTGPGTISVAVALSAGRPVSGAGLLAFFLGVSGAAVAVTLLVWIAYRFADRVAGWLGAPARRTIARLTASAAVHRHTDHHQRGRGRGADARAYSVLHATVA